MAISLPDARSLIDLSSQCIIVRIPALPADSISLVNPSRLVSNCGREVKIFDLPYRVIGVVEKQGNLFGLSLDERHVQFYVVAAGFVLVLWFLRRLIASPLGSIFIGIRENEQRMRAAGYPVQRFKLVAFTIAGAIAGVGGGLYALQNAFVSSDILHWSLSGDAIIMVILGGAGTIVGPAIGSAMFLLLKNVVSSHTEYWLLWVGVIFIVCVMFLRQGVWGWLRQRFAGRDSR